MSKEEQGTLKKIGDVIVDADQINSVEVDGGPEKKTRIKLKNDPTPILVTATIDEVAKALGVHVEKEAPEHASQHTTTHR